MNIEAVILAAGYSSRAGAFKMELDVHGKTVIERCIDGMIDICSRIIVVGGYRIERVQEILKDYTKVEVYYNSQYDKGMFTSVKEGMKHVRGDRFFFTPGDYPLISPEVCRQLIATPGKIVIPVFNGRKGHPVLFSREVTAEILGEDDDYNLRDYIHSQGFQGLDVDDEGILMDVDTPEDYQKVLENAAKGAG